nr:hypothetical protein [Streptomyces sp. SP18CM02]
MDDPAHRAGRRRGRGDQLRGVHGVRALPRAVRRHHLRVRRGAGRAGRPGWRRADRAPAVHVADAGDRVRVGEHRRALRRLRAGRRGPDPGGDVGRGDQGLLRPGQGRHPRRPPGRRHRGLTGAGGVQGPRQRHGAAARPATASGRTCAARAAACRWPPGPSVAASGLPGGRHRVGAGGGCPEAYAVRHGFPGGRFLSPGACRGPSSAAWADAV